MAVAPQHPVIGQALFFFAIVVPFTIFLTVLMVQGLGLSDRGHCRHPGVVSHDGLPDVQSARTIVVR